jgi:hypothetical protein
VYPAQAVEPLGGRKLVEVERQRRLVIQAAEASGPALQVKGDIGVGDRSGLHGRLHKLARFLAQRLQIGGGGFNADGDDFVAGEQFGTGLRALCVVCGQRAGHAQRDDAQHEY